MTTFLHRFHLWAPLLLCLSPMSAHPYETTGAWGGGGIQPQKAAGLSVEKKDLFISPALVHCSTAIKNNRKNDITTTIVFHVPYHPQRTLGNQNYWDEDVLEAKVFHHDRSSSWTLDKPDETKTPFMNFVATVNGKPVQAKQFISAVKGTVDVTELLKINHLPLSPEVATCSHLPLINFDHTECHKRAKKLHELNLTDQSGQPLWHKKVRFEWQQTIKADDTITIHYSYHPATGFISVHFDDERPPLESLAVGLLHSGCFLSNACFHEKAGLEQDLVGWLLKKFSQDLQAPEEDKGTYLYEVDYALQSDHFSEEPIKLFTLTVEHPEGGTAQVCPLWPDMQFERLSPTQIQASKHNFIPKIDLAAFIASPTLIKDVF